ncbi:hypothetical protein ONZ45_g4959 [Pleurotus djamor]|nr:hypothetical protein ONZ45_g4959 [Pleurotus djamor]
MISPAEFLDNSPTLAEVDQKIKFLQEDIRVLQRYRNARYSLVSRLPPEIISRIFEEMAFAIPKTSHWNLPKTPHRYWLSVTQVCHLWRKIAIDSPRLWTLVYTYTNKAFAKLCVERSRGLPLYLATFITGNHNTETVKYLLGEHSTRLWRLELRRSDPSWVDMLTLLDTPLLKEICLDIIESQALPFRTVSFLPMSSENIPPLRHISLTNWSLDLASPFLSQLRTLKLCYRTASHSSKVPLREMLLALKNFSHLEQLELDMIVDESSGSGRLDNIVVELPCLHTLRLSVLSPPPRQMLDNLSLPSIQSIVLCIAEVVSIAALAPVLEAFYRQIPPMPSCYSRVNVIANYPMFTSSMCIWPNGHDDGNRAPYEIAITRHPDFSASLTLFSLYSNRPPPVLSLFIGLRYRIDPYSSERNNLQQFLRSLSHVEELQASDFRDLCFFLSDIPKLTDANDQGTLPAFSLPSLKKILLKETVPYVLSSNGETFKQFERILEARKSMSIGIETLSITCHSSSLPTREAECLRGHVQTLEIENDD